MDGYGGYFWLVILLVLILLLLLFRKQGFRLAAEAFGGKVEVEGKGGSEGKAAPAKAAEPPPAPKAPGAHVQVGRDAHGPIVVGDGNRVGNG